MLLFVASNAKHAAEFMANRVNRARRAHDLGFGGNNGDEDGRNTFGFDLSLRRNDYPVADRSATREEHGVGLRSFDLVGNFWRQVFVLCLEVH